MDEGIIMGVMADTLTTGLMLAAPVLLISMAVGLAVAVLQAATQIHEQTLTFVPKLVAVGVALLLMGPWMSSQIRDFTYRLFEVIAANV